MEFAQPLAGVAEGPEILSIPYAGNTRDALGEIRSIAVPVVFGVQQALAARVKSPVVRRKKRGGLLRLLGAERGGWRSG